MVRSLRNLLVREPRGGPVYWFILLLGCADLVIGVFVTTSRGLTFIPGPSTVALGLMCVFWGASELLPKERRTATMVLRAGFVGVVPVVVVLAVASLAAAAA